MVTLSAPETAPPGLATVIAAEARPAIRLAGTVALNCRRLRNVVGSGEPFQSTMAPETKLVPLMVSAADKLPAVNEDGLTLVRVGSGRIDRECRGMWKAVPLAFTSRMVAAPVAAMRLAGTLAVTWVALTMVVIRGAPFHCNRHPAAQLLRSP